MFVCFVVIYEQKINNKVRKEREIYSVCSNFSSRSKQLHLYARLTQISKVDPFSGASLRVR